MYEYPASPLFSPCQLLGDGSVVWKILACWILPQAFPLDILVTAVRR